jgi:hypothetical protein
LKVEEHKKRNDGIKEARQSSLSAQHPRPSSHRPLASTMPPPSSASHRRTSSQGRSRAAAASASPSAVPAASAEALEDIGGDDLRDGDSTSLAAAAAAAYSSLADTELDVEYLAMAQLDEPPLMRSSSALDCLGDLSEVARSSSQPGRSMPLASRVEPQQQQQQQQPVEVNRQQLAAGVASSRRTSGSHAGALPRRAVKGSVVTG